MKEVVIVSAVRTSIGEFGGTLRTVPAYDLATVVLNEVINRANLEASLINYRVNRIECLDY